MDTVPPYRISLAVQVIRDFCVEKQVELDLNAITRISVAFARGKWYEWTPSTAPIRRIIFGTQKYEDQPRTFVTVYNYRGIDEPLTEELNNRITRATGGCWS